MVGREVQPARAVPEVVEAHLVGPQALAHDVGRGEYAHAAAEGADVGDLRGDVRRRVTTGDRTRLEARAGGQPVGPDPGSHAVQAQRAPVVAAEVVREQVPPPPPGHEVVRLHPPSGDRAVVGGVVELEDAAVAARGTDRDEGRGVDGRHRPQRGHRRDGHGRHATAQAAREDALELHERADRRLAEAGHPDATGSGRRLERHRDGDGLLVVEQQRRELRAGPEAVAAGRTQVHLDRVVEGPQLVDVAAHRAHRHPEPVGQFRAGPLGAGLQQREQAQQAGGGLEHPAILAREAVRR